MLFSKIDRRIDVGSQIEETFTNGTQRPAGTAGEPVESVGEFVGRTGVDHRQHRLRLEEIEPATEKRPQREFPPPGQTSAMPACCSHKSIDQRFRAGQLHLGKRPPNRSPGTGP